MRLYLTFDRDILAIYLDEGDMLRREGAAKEALP